MPFSIRTEEDLLKFASLLLRNLANDAIIGQRIALGEFYNGALAVCDAITPLMNNGLNEEQRNQFKGPLEDAMKALVLERDLRSFKPIVPPPDPQRPTQLNLQEAIGRQGIDDASIQGFLRSLQRVEDKNQKLTTIETSLSEPTAIGTQAQRRTWASEQSGSVGQEARST